MTLTQHPEGHPMPAYIAPSQCELCVPVRTSGHATSYTEYSHQTECPNHPHRQEHNHAA